jgi:hypothetical protein
MRVAPLALLLNLSLAMPVAAGAQGTTASEQVFAQVEILAIPLTIDVVGVTNFGSVFNYAHDEVIDPSSPTAGQTTAAIAIGSIEGRTLLINLGLCPMQLRTAEDFALDFASHFSYNTSANVRGAGADTALNPCEASVQVEPQADGEDPVLRYVYLWMGGRIGVAASQAPGVYSGVITITVEVL